MDTSTDINIEIPAATERKLGDGDEAEIARLCVNVTPKLRRFLRENVWETWPEEWLCIADGVGIDAPPFTEAQWFQLILERIPVESHTDAQ